jgi:hypothetical protein
LKTDSQRGKLNQNTFTYAKRGVSVMIIPVEEISEKDAELVFDRMMRLVQEDTGEAAREHLAAGHPVYYGDDAYPGYVVKQYPDGRKELVNFDKNGTEIISRSL